MPNRSTFSRDLIANETAADWIDALGLGSSYQPLDDTLTALAVYNTNGLVAQTAANTFTGRSIAVSGTGLSIANGDGVAGAPTITINPSAVVGAVGTIPTAAMQADQETGTSTTTFVQPGVQQFHPGHPKCWAYVTVSAGTPTLAASYNITSITDTGTGVLTITIATDFSSAAWSAVATFVNATILIGPQVSSIAAGAIVLKVFDTSQNPADPTAWSFAGFGDQ